MSAGLEQAIAAAEQEILTGAKTTTVPAVEQPDKEESTEVEAPDADSPEDKVEESESVESEESESPEELSEQELAEARFLYASLKNPTMRGPILASLLQQSEAPVETKKEQVVAKKNIAAMIEEALGPEFAFLTKKLGPAIEQAVESRAQDIREENAETARAADATRVNKEVVDEMAKLATETKGESKKLEAKMSKLSEVILPGPNTTIAQYIRVLYREASAGSSQKKVQAEVADKIKRNAADAPSRLASSATPRLRQSEITGPPDKRMSLGDSVKWAMEQMGKTPPKRGK